MVESFQKTVPKKRTINKWVLLLIKLLLFALGSTICCLKLENVTNGLLSYIYI